MDVKENMSGKYWKTCSKDITSSEGWFKKIMLLGLVSFVPVFGQMTLQGYAYEWAHKAAWGVAGPMPKKIYGRAGSPMLRWGWFAFALGIIIALIPMIITWIATFMVDAGLGVSLWAMYDPSYYYHGAVGAGSAVLLVIGIILMLVGLVASFAAYVVTWVSCMRMTVYNRFGAGMQLGKVFKMIKHDFGGIMRIFGMYLLTSLIIGAIYGILLIVFIFIGMCFVALFGLSASMGYGGSSMSDGQMAAVAIQTMAIGIVVALPLFLLVVYVLYVMSAWQTLLIARAMGYWTTQFDVARWGKKEDPMPFETAPSAANGTPVAPSQFAQPAPQGQSATQQPAPAQQTQQPASAPAGQAQPAYLQAPAGEPAAAPEVSKASEASGGPGASVPEADAPAPETPASAVETGAASGADAPEGSGDVPKN